MKSKFLWLASADANIPASFHFILDESTDIAIHKSMVMYVRYVHNGKIMTDFVGNIRVSDGKAETLVCAVADKLGQLQIDCDKVVGLASDGASVMTGRKTGVGARLAAKCPGLIQVHCVAHRLNLSCTDALKQHPYMRLRKAATKATACEVFLR
jgi:hypothetical protein